MQWTDIHQWTHQLISDQWIRGINSLLWSLYWAYLWCFTSRIWLVVEFALSCISLQKKKNLMTSVKFSMANAFKMIQVLFYADPALGWGSFFPTGIRDFTLWAHLLANISTVCLIKKQNKKLSNTVHLLFLLRLVGLFVGCFWSDQNALVHATNQSVGYFLFSFQF